MKLNLREIQQINLFEHITGSKVKNCFTEDGKLIFIVEENNIKRALGKENKNIKKVQSLLKKDIQIIGFSSNITKFINNILYPIKPDKIELKNNIIEITANDTRVKGKVYGRGRENLKKVKEITSKYFKIDDIKVI